jgi:predicted nucleotidyltransferase
MLAYLYGSVVDERTLPSSDLDIGLVLDPVGYAPCSLRYALIGGRGGKKYRKPGLRNGETSLYLR